ncbi:hypothetical protein [Mesorhizobium sp. B2-5-4]|uniref:hypothetical protein n=1 Tax=Mesorhizobium sp. B2-5-4 TaxID=2589926 RepID=UPI0015E2E643|nr:hypothetical protein [Mesorhizobium sp. B2-5-4]
MTEADRRSFGEFSNAPRPVRISQQRAQHLRRFGFEKGFEFPPFRAWLAFDMPLYEDAVKDNTGVARQIKKSDLVVPTQRLSLWREVRRDEDRYCAPIEMGSEVAQLEQPHTNVARLAARLDLADERMPAISNDHMRQDINAAVGAADRLDLDMVNDKRWDALQKRGERVCRLLYWW